MSVFLGNQLGFLQETPGHGRTYFSLEMLFLCLQNRSLWHPDRVPGRHHMTISESLTCFSDPKVFSLKFFPENEGMHNLCSSSCRCSLPFTVKSQHWLGQILPRTAFMCESYWHLWLSWLNWKCSLFLLSDFFYYLFAPLFFPLSSHSVLCGLAPAPDAFPLC